MRRGICGGAVLALAFTIVTAHAAVALRAAGTAAWSQSPAGQAPAPGGQTPAANPDRWELDIQKFEAQDKVAPPPKNGVVFIGSSSIVKWNLPEAFPALGARAINRGFGGSVMADAVRYVDRIVVPYQPKIVVLYEGDNDLTTLTAEQIGQQFVRFVHKVHGALPEARIVVIGIKPSVQRWALVDKMRAANTLIRNYSDGKPFITYVDVDAPMLGPDGRPRPELYVEDGLHMSPAGYKIWNDLVRPLVME